MDDSSRGSIMYSFFFFSASSEISEVEQAGIDIGEYYGTLTGANEYFSQKLFETAWTDSPPAWHPAALWRATKIIDDLNYKGAKHAVYGLSSPSRDEVIAADSTQPLEFPRGPEMAVPLKIEQACYEIAYALLEGVDQQDQSEAQDIQRQAYGSVRTSYGCRKANADQITHGVPSSVAWRMLKPFLTGGAVNGERV
jgi:hypothetical protein